MVLDYEKQFFFPSSPRPKLSFADLAASFTLVAVGPGLGASDFLVCWNPRDQEPLNLGPWGAHFPGQPSV